MATAREDEDQKLAHKSDAWTDLALTLPIFLVYQLGVVFLPVRNAADPVTRELRALANESLLLYSGLTLAVGAALVAVLVTIGRGQAFDKGRFAFVAIEGTLYAAVMRAAGAYAVGSLRLGPPESVAPGVFGGVIGCLLLLLRNRLAFPVLLASLIGAIVSNLGGLFLLGGLEVMRETGGLGFTAVPIIFGAVLAYYARALSKKGVLGE